MQPPQDAVVMRPIESGDNDAQKARAVEQLNFMTTILVQDQFRLCKERMIECMGKVIEEIKARGWKVGVKNNHIILPYVKTVGGDVWGRIGLTIGPDTYRLCYIETALLSAINPFFIDTFGYVNQETKKWLTFDDAVSEIEGLLKIYEALEGVRE